MHARNIRAWCSPICVPGPPGPDFADSAAVARNLVLNSLGHLYITVCNKYQTGCGHLEQKLPQHQRKIHDCRGISIAFQAVYNVLPMKFANDQL